MFCRLSVCMYVRLCPLVFAAGFVSNAYNIIDLDMWEDVFLCDK